MRHDLAATLVLALGACQPPAEPAAPTRGLPEDFPPSILGDLPEADRPGVARIIAIYSEGLVGHCTKDQIAAALATPTILAWFGFAERRSPASMAYIERNQQRLAEESTALPEPCRQRMAELAEQIPE